MNEVELNLIETTLRKLLLNDPCGDDDFCADHYRDIGHESDFEKIRSLFNSGKTLIENDCLEKREIELEASVHCLFEIVEEIYERCPISYPGHNELNELARKIFNNAEVRGNITDLVNISMDYDDENHSTGNTREN